MGPCDEGSMDRVRKVGKTVDNSKSRYNHKVDKSQIPTCNIMGVNVAAIDMPWLLEFTQNHLSELSGDYMCVANVHTTVTAYDDKQYCEIQNGGVMAIPDGGPLSSIGRKRGHAQMQRTTGPNYMEEVIKSGILKGYRHFFYGSTEETLARMEQKLIEQYPDILIAGMYSPPFRMLTEEEDLKIVEMINQSNADFVWVALGAPKQEKWMEQHQGRIKAFMVGVGAAFDYFAGNISRAPQWMQRCNLEWLYRLLQDPKRLFKRYLYTNTKFIWEVVVRRK